MYNTSGNTRCYASILHLPHPTSPTHPRMSVLSRAAQFAAFDALAGYSASIQAAAAALQEVSAPAAEDLEITGACVEFA